MIYRGPLEIRITDTRSYLKGKCPREAIDKELSFSVPNAFHTKLYKIGRWDGKDHLLESNHFPTGLLPRVLEILKDHRIQPILIDQRKPLPDAGSFRLPGITWRGYQKLVIGKAVKQKRGVIQIPTAGGKTLIAAGIIKSLNQPTAFLVHTRALIGQTKEVFEEFFPNIGIVGGGERDFQRITIFSVRSLLSLIERGETQFLDPFRVLFVDECHHVASVRGGKKVNPILKANGWRASWYVSQEYFRNASARFGLSATPVFTKRGLLLTAATGELIHSIPTKDLQDQGYLSEAEVNFIKIKDPNAWNLTYQEAYREAIVENDLRNEFGVKRAIHHAQNGKMVMVFVRLIDHGHEIEFLVRDRIRNLGIKDLDFLFVSGKNSRAQIDQARKSAAERKLSILIATKDLFGEGVNIPAIDVLINLAGGRSATAFQQLFGRGLRIEERKDRLVYIDFLDKTNHYLLTHSNARILQCRKMKQRVLRGTTYDFK